MPVSRISGYQNWASDHLRSDFGQQAIGYIQLKSRESFVSSYYLFFFFLIIRDFKLIEMVGFFMITAHSGH